jgi:preprotein translocase subunit YajC
MEVLIQFSPIIFAFVVLYLLFIIPEKKKKKRYNQMLQELKVNDEITTIGGVVGRIISIEEDSIILESGPDRTKLRFAKYAISSRNHKEN